MTISLIKLLRQVRRTTAVSLAVCVAVALHALDLGTYAEASVLASGRWVKVAVPANGVYRLSAQTLRSMGFTDLTRVRVHGYGGQRVPDILSVTNFVDDLPVAPSEQLADGTIIFYGRGPETWVRSTENLYYAQKNPYATQGYYLVGESGAEMPDMPEGGTDVAAQPKTTFRERVQHEQDISTAGESGSELFGEDFRFTPRRQFKISTPGRADDKAMLQTSFVCRTLGTPSRITVTLNNNTLPAVAGDNVSATISNSHIHGVEAIANREVTYAGEVADITIQHTATSTVYGAWLNYIAINYNRHLALDKNTGALTVFTTDAALRVATPADDVRVWDVTSASRTTSMRLRKESGAASWQSLTSGLRTYAVWSPSLDIPEPKICGVVKNQNLHAHSQADMVIVSPRQWASQAERIAGFHRQEGMTVLVVDPEEIYNEFSSGGREVGGIRRFFKMLYDRGAAEGRPLRYALLMARGTFDERHLTAGAGANPTLPFWQNPSLRAALSDEEGYGTDDVVAMLGDNTGSSRGLDPLSIAVGRIPVTSLAGATNYVDKLEQYIRRPKMTGWKNSFMLMVDDEDQAVHMVQAEKMLLNLNRTAPDAYNVNKVYLDAHRKVGGVYETARDQMFRALNDGTAWWGYIGHANNHSMTADGQVTYNDINNMYLKHLPVMYAATCDFLRWDSHTLSGGEILFNERYGGVIAMISATRPVYIYENGLLSEAMGRHIGSRDTEGHYLRLGDVYRRAKNDIRSSNGNLDNNVNRLRYVLMGDPAMRLPNPDNRVCIETLNGQPLGVDESEYPIVSARSTAVFEGYVAGPDGQPLDHFDGTVTATIFDAERSITTNGNGNGTPYTYDEQGGRLFAGAAPVKNGRFALRAVIPAEIADNMRPAAVSLYALSGSATLTPDSLASGVTAVNGYMEAAGIERRFYVSGFDATAEEDKTPPVINYCYLNSPANGNGARVNASPMLTAEVLDNNSINLSTAGIGHTMTIILDGSTTYNDVANFFTPDNQGRPGGTINYPLENLREGKHTLTLRVWDGDGNHAQHTLDFVVDNKLAPEIFEVYSDANPATTQANFYVRHDRPDRMGTLTVTVYNLLGHPLWSKTVTGQSDMMLSAPVTWNLTDAAGRRVKRGIYLYRATFAGENGTDATKSHRIAVTD